MEVTAILTPHAHQPENLVLQDKDAKQLKIIDFGTAQDLNINPKVKVMVGTPEFIGESMFRPQHSLSLMAG